jgi:hypothetical protein
VSRLVSAPDPVVPHFAVGQARFIDYPVIHPAAPLLPATQCAQPLHQFVIAVDEAAHVGDPRMTIQLAIGCGVEGFEVDRASNSATITRLPDQSAS